LERFFRDATEAYTFLLEAVLLPAKADQVSAVLGFPSLAGDPSANPRPGGKIYNS